MGNTVITVTKKSKSWLIAVVEQGDRSRRKIDDAFYAATGAACLGWSVRDDKALTLAIGAGTTANFQIVVDELVKLGFEVRA